MKRVTVLVVGMLLALLACQFVPAVTYTESADATNNSHLTAEIVGSLSAGSTAIKGSFSSVTDVDYYKVDMAGATTLNYEVFYNGSSQKNALGISFFPFSFYTYDAGGNILTNYLYMAGLGTESLDPGTSYVIFGFFANADYPSGTYELDLK